MIPALIEIKAILGSPHSLLPYASGGSLGGTYLIPTQPWKQSSEETMPLQSIANRAVEEILDAVSAPIGSDERDKIKKIIEQAIIDASVTTSQQCGEAVNRNAGPDDDLAHKYAEKIKQTEKALIANLMGLR